MIFAQMAFLGYTRVYPCRFCMFLRGQYFLSHTQMGGRRSQNRRSDVRSVGRVGLWPLPRFEPISKASRWNLMAFPNRFRRPLSCWDSWWVAGCFSLQLEDVRMKTVTSLVPGYPMKRRQETPIFNGKNQSFLSIYLQTNPMNSMIGDVPYVPRALLQDLSHSISKFEEGSAKLIAKDGHGQLVWTVGVWK